MRNRTLGVILAGGRSSRFGADKALALLNGRPMAAHVAQRLCGQVDAIALNTNGDAPAYASLQIPLFEDGAPTREGPLAGIVASLAYAQAHGFDDLVTVPCDAPALCADLASRLRAARDAAAVDCAFAKIVTVVNPVFALYRIDLQPAIAALFQAGVRAPRDLPKHLRSAFAPFTSAEARTLADIDTLADLRAFGSDC